MKLGSNIKTLRIEKGYNQIELSEKLGVSQTSIAHYEKGTRQPPLETLIQMADLFEVSIDQLIGHEVQKKQDKHLSKADLEKALLQALLLKDESKFLNLFETEVYQKYPVADIIDDILKKLLYQIGQQWQERKISEADEHFATHVIRKALHYMSYKHQGLIKGKKAISMAIDQEPHTMGIEMVTTYLETLGIKTLYLGTQVPTYSLDQMIKDYQPDYLFISVTVDIYMHNLMHLIDHVNETYHQSLKIGIGGQGIKDDTLLKMYPNVTLLKANADINRFINQ